MKSFIQNISDWCSKLLLLIFLLLYLPQMASTQENPLSQDTLQTGAYLQLRSISVNVVWIFFIAGVSGSIDIDVFRFSSPLYSTIGFRFGIDHYISGHVGGKTPGSPLTDYNILLRHTASGRLLRFDIYFGWSYYTSSDPVYHPPHGGLKLGLELRMKIVDHFFALLLKLSKPGGFGGSIGWDR